jgi:hypothetical protein
MAAFLPDILVEPKSAINKHMMGLSESSKNLQQAKRSYSS